MMKTSKGLTEITLQKCGNMERAARGNDRTGRFLTYQGKKMMLPQIKIEKNGKKEYR